MLALLTPERFPLIPCPFNQLTGHSCLTCGLTRSLHALLHGDLSASIQYHLMGPVLLGGILVACVLWVVEASTGRRLRVERPGGIQRPAIFLFAAAWIAYSAVRLTAEFIR
jgi:hypothetical protein